jgi:hypothetical protein
MTPDSRKLTFLAYYLPQFHPIPENDEWWGKGFTEWTNVTKAKPLFKDHDQPLFPADLGYYDLRVPEVRKAQSDLAQSFGIDGFIYYQYWFGDNRMLLESPAEEMLKDKEVKIPFCFCWANETWKGVWHGLHSDTVLIEQKYLGNSDYKDYFYYLLPFFKDDRYIKIDNKPMFHIYRLEDIPNHEKFLEFFNQLAINEGFNGIAFVATILDVPENLVHNELIYGQVGVDVFRKMRYSQNSIFESESFLNRVERKIKKWKRYFIPEKTKPKIYDYKKSVEKFNANIPHKKYIPCVFPNWDNSPRSGRASMIFKNATPTLWHQHLKKTMEKLLQHPQNPPFVVIKSWNEWAEGNYLEPDEKYGTQWLEKVKITKESMENCFYK